MLIWGRPLMVGQERARKYAGTEREYFVTNLPH